jgi:hypothetical protein
MEEKNNPDNLVSIADARKRQKVLRKGANGRDPDHGKNPNKKHDPKKPVQSGKIWFYVQFVLFLALLAFFMQKCRG